MKIPLVIGLEGLHAGGDFVRGEAREIAVPVRVHGPEGLETAADPILKFLVALLRGRLDRIVNRANADALGRECADLLEMIADEERMPAAAVAVHHDRRRAFENFFIRNPAVGVDLGDNAGHARQGFGEEQAAGAVLMRERPVADAAGDEDDFFVGRLGSEGG